MANSATCARISQLSRNMQSGKYHPRNFRFEDDKAIKKYVYGKYMARKGK